jgi:hypothetical protein
VAGRCVAERVDRQGQLYPDHRLEAPHCGSLLKGDGGVAGADAGTAALRSAQTVAGEAPRTYSCH